MLGTLSHPIRTFNFNVEKQIKEHRENKVSNNKIINGKFKVVTPMDKIYHEDLLGDKKLNETTKEVDKEVKGAKQVISDICKMED